MWKIIVNFLFLFSLCCYSILCCSDKQHQQQQLNIELNWSKKKKGLKMKIKFNLFSNYLTLTLCHWLELILLISKKEIILFYTSNIFQLENLTINLNSRLLYSETLWLWLALKREILFNIFEYIHICSMYCITIRLTVKLNGTSHDINWMK